MIQPIDTELPAEQPEQPRDWYFTFGYGQRIFAQNRLSAERGEPVQGSGFPVDSYYVIIRGTDYRSARERMVEIFGPVWSFQYAELPSLADLPGSPQWQKLVEIPAAGPAAG